MQTVDSDEDIKRFQAYIFYQLKQGSFLVKLHSVFQDLNRRSIGTSFWPFSDAVQIIKIRFLM